MGRSKSRLKRLHFSESLIMLYLIRNFVDFFRSNSSGSDRFQEENCQYDPVSKGYRIHLADLPDNPDEDELQREFSRYGNLSERPWVARASPCFGFVVFKHKDDAWDACRKMDNK